MKKNFIYLFFCLFLFGCAYHGDSLQTFIDDTKALIKDPHFAKYQEDRNSLEHQYLKKKITYSEYLDRVEKLDLIYAKEVQERVGKIEGNRR